MKGYITRFVGGPLDKQDVPWPSDAIWPPTERIVAFRTEIAGWLPIQEREDSFAIVAEFTEEFKDDPPALYARLSMSELSDGAVEQSDFLIRGAEYEYVGPYEVTP